MNAPRSKHAIDYPSRLYSQREALDVTQQRLASLLGVSFVSLSRWENGHTMGDLGRVLITLLDGALRLHAPTTVIEQLQAGDGTTLHAIRTLSELERVPKRRSA